MKPTIKTSSTDSTAKLKASLAQLAKKQVYVGVPEDQTSRGSGGVTNAGLLYLHTHGSALQNIPARPVIEPAIQASDNKALLTKELGAAAQAVLDGKPAEAKQGLNRAGQLGANAAKRWFTDPRNGWRENAPATIERKGSDKPLIDTGELRRSITYVVEDESER